MLSSAVSQGNRLASWNTTPTRSGSGASIGRPVAQDGAGGLVAQARHHHQQRGLAAAARADDHDEAPGADRQRDVLAAPARSPSRPA